MARHEGIVSARVGRPSFVGPLRVGWVESGVDVWTRGGLWSKKEGGGVTRAVLKLLEKADRRLW